MKTFILLTAFIISSQVIHPQINHWHDPVSTSHLSSSTSPPSPMKPPCSSDKMREIREKATTGNDAVIIDCSCALNSGDVITKTLVLRGEEGSNVVINGNSAKVISNLGAQKMLIIKSEERDDNRWNAPHDILVKNLFVKGRITLGGVGPQTTLRRLSRLEGYVERLRNNAPRNVEFEKITVEAIGGIPLYLYPGVTYVTVSNSDFKGHTDDAAVYLDAESCCNTFRNNSFNVSTSREVIAIDASNHNRFINNSFKGLDDGGIYLYRNCGEDSVIRHTTPEYNQIINNTFYYNHYTGPKPLVYLGSRRGAQSFCALDDDYDFGSGKSNLDHAKYNVVMQNQIFKRTVQDMIISQNWKVNSPNFINYNSTVQIALLRKAGCYVSANGYKKDFILHGDSVEVLRYEGGQPVSYYYSCYDGELTKQSKSAGEITAHFFECRVTVNNIGCKKSIKCPGTKTIFGARVAANLENGVITDQVLASVGSNTIEVIIPSDNESEGICYFGRNESSNKLSYGIKPLQGIDGENIVLIGCKEHDSNVGDCHIKAILYCR